MGENTPEPLSILGLIFQRDSAETWCESGFCSPSKFAEIAPQLPRNGLGKRGGKGETMTIVWKHRNLVGITVDKETEYPHPTAQGLRLRVYPNGRKTWVFQRMMDGRRHKKTLGRFPALSMVQAELCANVANAALDIGEDPFPVAVEKEPERTRMTVAEGWDRYVEDMVRRNNKSVHARDLLGKKDIVAPLGGKNLADVTTDDVRDAINRPIERAKAGGKRAGIANTGGVVTSNHVLRACKTFFKFCLDSGYDGMQRNPALAIRAITSIKGKRRKRILTVRELALLIVAARELDRRRSHRTTWGDIISVLVLNGNRKSEVYSAFSHEWNSDLCVWHIGGERYKTGVDAVLPVGPTTAGIFDRRATAKGYVFPSQTGVRTGQDRHVCDQLTEIMEEIGGEPIERWSMHSTRYGFRSGIRKTKIADSELAEKIIHPKAADDAVEYDPDWQDEMRAALEAWDALIQAEIASITAERIKEVA